MSLSWELYGKSTFYGRLHLDHIDQPWFHCRFEPTEAFQEVQPLFEEEIRLLNSSGKIDEWERSYETIDQLQLELRSTAEHSVITDFLLHIEGDSAWFRY